MTRVFYPVLTLLNMRKFLVLFFSAIILASGCTEWAEDSADFEKPGTSHIVGVEDASPQDTEKTSTTIKSGGESVSFAESNNRFAVDLFRELASESDNVFISPWSISVALSMVYEGAKGNTRDEMMQTLHLCQDDEYRKTSMKDAVETIKKGEYELSTANAIWPQMGYPLLDEYVAVLERHYGISVRELDYARDPQNARQTINAWVMDETGGKIEDLIPEGLINRMTTLILTNAIYFKGNWALEFDPENTFEDDFHISAEKTEKVEMMSLSGENARFKHGKTGDISYVSLPYEGGMSMMIMLPQLGKMEELIGNLSHEGIESMRDSMSYGRLDVRIPKFSMDEKYLLADTLKAMGVKDAFTGAADFSGMDGTKNQFISHVIHQSHISVDEQGTEAAAATAVIMQRTSLQIVEKFEADRPFIFIIMDEDEGSILFIGSYAGPN